VATHDDVRRMALSLPEATEVAGDDLAFEVAGKRFVWLWRERVRAVAPKELHDGS
jgi:hypothetical protein